MWMVVRFGGLLCGAAQQNLVSVEECEHFRHSNRQFAL